MKRPTIGELDKFVTVRKRQDFATDDNQTEPTFLVKKNRWANIEPVGGSTYLLSKQTDNTITHRIKLRYMPEIDGDYEVVYKNIVYRVVRQMDLQGQSLFTVVEATELNQVEIYP